MTNKGKNWRAGQSQNHAVTARNTIVGRLWKDYALLGTWAAVGRKYGIGRSMAFRVARGHEPKDAVMRRVLGMPELSLAPVCTTCGVVHVSPRCPTKAKPAKPRRNIRKIALSALGALWGEKKS